MFLFINGSYNPFTGFLPILVVSGRMQWPIYPLGPRQFLNLGGPGKILKNLRSAIDFSLLFELRSNFF